MAKQDSKVIIKPNEGCEFESLWLDNVNVNLNAVNRRAETFRSFNAIQNEYEIAFLLKAVTLIDLTTLGGDDTNSNVTRLCQKASQPLSEDFLRNIGFVTGKKCPIKTAAICVYPSRVPDAAAALKKLDVLDKISIASVATGFPSGQMPLSTRLEEIKYAVEQGATEIDIVINRTLVHTGQWEELYNEIKQMKQTCGHDVHMKSILAVGELGSMDNIYKASMVAMMAGSDFIKTSTGKEAVNATLPFGVIMARAIYDYYEKTGYKVGLKPAGGIKTYKDAIAWMVLIKEELGTFWLNKNLFRFGASSLLGDIEQRLYYLITNCNAANYEFTMG